MRNRCFFILMAFFTLPAVYAQRSYKNSSVLASGNWYKIAVKEPGIYKVDMAMLNKLGISTSNLASASIRLYGNGGAMLPEACNGSITDDLAENAIEVVDGGDGIFNGNDYFLFFAQGPDIWTKDSVNQRFKHQKNLYNSESYYFVSFGGTGKRIQAQINPPTSNVSVTSFSERWSHELDTVNLLNSSKDWYGEELSALPGRTKSFTLPIINSNNSQPATIVLACIARSVRGTSRFNTTNNGTPVMQQDIASVGSTNLDLFARNAVQVANFSPANASTLACTFTPGGSNAQGWLDWFEIFYRRNLSVTGNEQLLFRDWNSVAPANIALFTLQNAASTQVWDITRPASPIKMAASVNGSNLSFKDSASTLHEYICFSNNFLAPLAVGKIANQDLHNSQPADLLIVCYPPLLQQAERIAVFHQQKDNLKTATVTTTALFNEFASGTPDPVAIRDFVKMYYDKAGTVSGQRPKYLLLLGDASYDYKNRIKNNSNFVPGYENNTSLDPLSTYTSDDFFGFLDDNEDINAVQLTNLLDIGIGRIPAQTPAEAKAYVDKLINYTDPKSLGAWRNQQTFIADDQDANLHLNDAEIISSAAAATSPLFVQNKIYLDAFTQNSSPWGSRYPAANQVINQQVQNGTLIWNYNGHGSSGRLAEEVMLDKEIADQWTNTYRLPLFITATCDFAPYDNPAVASLGENILLRENTGAIALMTTTRLVFAFSNRIMNRNYLQSALQPGANGNYPSLGDAVRLAKNMTYQTQLDIVNNRKFTLLGDPALTIAFPKYRVQTTTINGKPVQAIPDTLKALEKYNIGGAITDAQGNAVNNFNGTLSVTVSDKPQTATTLANDADSYQQAFQVPGATLFKGSAKVVNGKFNFSFIVPKDIHYSAGNGRINYYAENGLTDGNGNFNGFLVGGSQGVSSDNAGPVIKAYINDETFVNGNAVPFNPELLLQLSDSSGINIAGTGIGHDITAVADGDISKIYVLNQFFESATDSYQQGTVKFQLPDLEEGVHTLVIKAWDVNNNSSEVTIRFRVLKKEGIIVSRVANYPNPFASHTRFWFEHNRPNAYLNTEIRILTVTGKAVKSIKSTINTSGNRSSDIDWDGRGDNGEMLAPGLYIYQVLVTSAADGQTAVKTGKLVRR